MNKQYYFMSGLPRSGSSMLSSILNQNPNFYCGPSSPVVPTFRSIIENIDNNELYKAYPKESFKNNLTSSVIQHYYDDIDKPFIFDKNRSWTRYINEIKKYLKIENPKIIVTVRNIDEILASFITLIHKNKDKKNFIDEALKNHYKVPVNDFTRCQYIASDGPLGRSYSGIEEALKSGFSKHLHFVEYKHIVSNPERTMKKIYKFLGQDYYEHDFNNIVTSTKEKDCEVYGLSGMHDVRPVLKCISKKPKDVLPKKVIEDVAGLEFWRKKHFDIE